MLEEIIELSNFSNKTAIVYEGKSITYSDLNALTSKIATKLKSSGVTPESSIIVFLPRGIEFIATILAALKLGAFYVPLETSAQLNRFEYMKHDCDAKLLIDESFIKNLPEKADNFEPQNSGGCIIYTSGSTGKPKVVKISKSAISTHILNIIESFSITSDTKFLFLNQNSFVAHVFFIFLTLFSGGTLHIASNETRKDINKIQKYIEENAITHTSMPLQLYKFFSLKKSTLKQIYIGSEKISNVESIGDYDLYNVYGSSETLWATYFKIDKKYSNTPITMPIKGQEVILLDDNNQITKTEGVIAVSGCTSDCYVNREEENKEKYININGKNFVKTNDVAKYDENGNLIYLNRNDWMVKISGQRVEPSEIEAVIKTFDGITETVVKAFENKHNQAYLCGYFTAHNKIDLNSLRNFVSKELPSYMLPSFFVQLDEFKFNENGKLDRKSLTPPDVTQYLTEYVAPETEKENEIVDAFKKVLDLEKLGVNDDFFALGGNSIKTIALLENLKYNLSATDIMTLKTPKNIAEFCNNSTTTVEYKSNPIQEQYDLTDSEMGVYLDCLGDNRTNYNLPNMLTFPKSIVSVEKLNEILSDFVDNHIGLKANFKNINGEIKKVINNRPKTIEIIKLNGNLDEIKKEFVRPFNLENENLYRFLVCEDEENVYLLLDIHHIVFDGTSITVLINSIKTVLEGGEVQAEEISALDVNIYQKESIQNGEFKESEDYIEQKFGGNEFATKIKGDVYDNDKVDTEIQHISLLDEEIREDSIKNFLNTNHITENTYFLGAFAYCLSKFTNEEEFAFGSINNGRHNKCLKNTVGMLVKTLPLVYKVDEESSICEFLQYVQNDFHQTIKYSKFSFVDFVKKYELKPEINFIYQDEMLNSAEILGETVKFEGLPNKDLISNFSLMLFKTNGRYRVELSYNNKIYSKKYISSFINFYNQVLKEFMCKSNLKDIELLTEYDKQLHLEFNSQHFEYDETKTIIDLFKEQVVKTPDNIALVYKENKYTYKELDEITDRIAKHIVSKGLKRGEYVGVLVNRSEFMYISAIGVLKSGCAYQPLDLKNPPERLNYMVENSECRFVILDRELEQLIDFNGEKLFVDKIKSLKDVDIELPKLSIEDKFVLLFTSGTTGLPKGVELSHKNALNYMLAMKKSLPIFDENCRSLEYASFGFDAHMATIYDVLTSGGTSYIASEDLKLNIIELHNYLMENKITSIFSSTQMLKQYVMQFGDNPYLKLYGAGGEAMPVLDLPKYQLVNLYGPTECTLQAACFPIDKKYNFIPIGQSFGNNITYIVDKYQRLLPIGAVGEICVAGNQVGTGYLKRDDLNKEKFITNTYDDKFEKIYKTGDIARYLPDGNLDIMGRRDMQVKIRGFRIELTEIENRILEFEGIDDATVIAKDSTAGGKYVVGYIVSKNTIDTKALKSFIKEQLPAYMVPEIIMQIEAIPHTINGKVDKRKLPEPVRTERNQK